MSPRSYRLGRREEAVGRTRAAILAAARTELASGSTASFSAGAVARRAGVSRITVYNQFGSKAGLLRELASSVRLVGTARHADMAEPRDPLQWRIQTSCAKWATDPALFRRLPAEAAAHLEAPGEDRVLAERIAASGQLRPGCSLKEAEDVIGALTSFPVFDRLHKDGRRSSAAVAEILLRLAAAILRAYSA
jgi:AcrR family transcriptional regulator